MRTIQLVAAPSILGLRPTGVEMLADTLLAAGLKDKIHAPQPTIHLPLLNDTYDEHRDPHTRCLNSKSIEVFSSKLARVIAMTGRKKQIAVVLGGDCSILLGVMAGLKSIGTYGLIFMDAHADFYSPEQSPTGEVADMDLAIVTGRGPAQLTNLNELRPYVSDENVIHVGQRDEDEARSYGALDIRDTLITSYDLKHIRRLGIDSTIKSILSNIYRRTIDGFWIHFDTDVLSDNENPAVDYRLPGGLTFEETAMVLKTLFHTDRIAGISVTIFNPSLDQTGKISRKILHCLSAIA